MSKAGHALRFLDKLAASTIKKSVLDDELVVIEWKASGVVLMHLDVSGNPKIKRLAHVRFDGTMGETEKRNACRQFLDLVGSKKYPKAVLCWSDGMTFRQLQLPDMPREDLLKAFAWDLKKKYYFNTEENLFAYKEVMSVESEEGASEKLYNIFYCENKIALPRLDFIIGLGLDIQAVVPTQAALAHFIASTEDVSDKDVLVCEISGDTARILVARGELDMMTRNISLGGAEGALTDEVLARLSEELRKTIDYHEGQKFGHPVGKVLFCGEEAGSMRLLDFMTPKLSVPVAVPNLEKALSGALDENEKSLALTHSGVFTAALGAALMAEDTLNLVPDDIRTKNQYRRLDRWLNLGLIGLGLFLLLTVLGTVVNLRWAESRLDVLKKEHQALSENKKVLEDQIGRAHV